MFRKASVLLSTALHDSTPFLDGALQLIKLHLTHRNARSDGNQTACAAIEEEFCREVETFRPCFTMSASLAVAQQYSRRLYSALHYFGFKDDPLVRQLDLMLGRHEMQASASRSCSYFKGPNASASRQAHAPAKESSFLHEAEEMTLPTELPNAPQVDLTSARRPGAVRVPLRYRGHWVLQEPEIAITKNERREDPW